MVDLFEMVELNTVRDVDLWLVCVMLEMLET